MNNTLREWKFLALFTTLLEKAYHSVTEHNNKMTIPHRKEKSKEPFLSLKSLISVQYKSISANILAIFNEL